MRRLLATLTVGLLSLLGPLIVPTPTGPKLRLPEVQAPPPSLMLEKRPLQIKPSQSRPTLNVLPPADPELSPDDGVEESAPADGGEARPGVHLRHGR